MADIPLKGYPSSMGNKYRMVWDHTGPASYANIGTSSGAGDVILAGPGGFNFGGFETLELAFATGYTQSGNFFVKAFTGSGGTVPTLYLPRADAFPRAVLQWFTTSAPFGTVGAEVANGVNLSAERLRFGAWLV